MGVLSCNRPWCENIMCDRLSHEYGYLCDKCFEELLTLGLKTDIQDFMDTRPQRDNPEIIFAYFNEKFPERN